MLSKIINAILGPATVNSGGTEPATTNSGVAMINSGETAKPVSWLDEKIEAIRQAELEAEAAKRREAIEKSKQIQLEDDAMNRKFTGGLYEFLTPYFEFARESRLEQVLRRVEKDANIYFYLNVRDMNVKFKALVEGNWKEGSMKIDLRGTYRDDIEKELWQNPDMEPRDWSLVSIDQISGPDYDFVSKKFTHVIPRDFDGNLNDDLRYSEREYETYKSPTNLGLREAIRELRNSPIQIEQIGFDVSATQPESYKYGVGLATTAGFRYVASWSDSHHRMIIDVDAPKKTIDVVGAETFRLIPEDLKNPEALEEAVVRAYVHPIVIPSPRITGNMNHHGGAGGVG